MNKYYVLIIDTLVTSMPISFLGLPGDHVAKESLVYKDVRNFLYSKGPQQGDFQLGITSPYCIQSQLS